jgi:hypothetical protein
LAVSYLTTCTVSFGNKVTLGRSCLSRGTNVCCEGKLP